MKKVLITGSTGFIGKKLVIDLINNNKIVYAIIRNTKKNYKYSIKIKKEYKNFFPIFFTKNSEIKKKIFNLNPNVVINLATNFIPNPNHHQLSSIMNSNVIFPTIILDTCCKSNISKFINLCSTAQCDKNVIDNPQNFYAMTKIMFKQCMSYYKKKNPKINFLNVYIGDTYGAHDNRKKLFPTIIKNYKKNKRTTILTKKLKINVVHVNDIINGIKILINKVNYSSDFLIKSQKNIILGDLIKKFNSRNKKKIKVLWLNKKVVTLNNVNVKKIPNWKEKFDVVKYFCKDLNGNN